MAESISNAEFRDCLAEFASGVTVVTCRFADEPVGFTATAFTSVSLDPPLVLVCVARQGRAHGALVHAVQFGISVLAESQTWIARRFASRGVDRFGGVPLREKGSSRLPLIGDAVVQLVCEAHTRVDVGDHMVLVGRVTDVARSGGRPLVHFARRFGGFVPAPDEASDA